ncbi:MAG: glycosyltransferase family 2 protein [Kiritimatiellae bacterium]|nr:glycosyltransferase family 2 protein [Kiritimatiellia bacterium]
MPALSIITASFNSASVIETAIDSVLNQSLKDLEYLVVDGGSTDATTAIVRAHEARFDGRLRWLSEQDRGMYDALNKGICLATGDVIGILNADDFLATDHILGQIAAAFDDPDVDCVFGNIRFVRDPDLGRTVRYYRAKHFRPWMLRFGFMPPHPSFFARRELFERFGAYKTDYRISADYELLVRFLWVHRLRYRYLDLTTTRMRLGGVSTRSLKSTYVLNREIVKACRENGMFTALPLLFFKYLFKVFELLNTSENENAADGGTVVRGD